MQQENDSLFVLLFRKVLFLCSLKSHARCKLHCYTNFATWSPHMNTVFGARCVTVPIKHNNCFPILLNNIRTVLLTDLVICCFFSPRDRNSLSCCVTGWNSQGARFTNQEGTPTSSLCRRHLNQQLSKKLFWLGTIQIYLCFSSIMQRTSFWIWPSSGMFH